MLIKSAFLTLLMTVAGSCLDASLIEKAENSLAKAISYFYSINSHGGYVYYVTPDLSHFWGESQLDSNTIEVQPPGTPAVGMSFLRAYQATGNQTALKAAADAAFALLKGQNKHGGWGHVVNLSTGPVDEVSFDDNQTQYAISFLMALDQEIDDSRLDEGIGKALDLMLKSQLDSGGWPHKYPEQGNYHDFATFNDGGINDCIRVLSEAYKHYGRSDIRTALLKAGRFLMLSQLPPPQPGWAQQYNEFMQPAWARTFEPPSVCPSVTIKNIHTLLDMYSLLGNKSYLEPIPDSLRWLDEIQLDNGKWARFIELGTGKPLYYDRGRIRVDSIEDLHIERRSGYAYQTDISRLLAAAEKRFEMAINLSRKELREMESPKTDPEDAARRLERLTEVVEGIIESQEESGAWITRNDRFKKKMPSNERWNGQYQEMDRISSAVFNRNVHILCEYVELHKFLNRN